MHEREEAAAAGRIIYDGKPCRRGHGTARYVLSNVCVTCDREKAKAQYKARKAFTARLKAIRQKAKEAE